jgi:predicted transcriptional regulator
MTKSTKTTWTLKPYSPKALSLDTLTEVQRITIASAFMDYFPGLCDATHGMVVNIQAIIELMVAAGYASAFIEGEKQYKLTETGAKWIISLGVLDAFDAKSLIEATK